MRDDYAPRDVLHEAAACVAQLRSVVEKVGTKRASLEARDLMVDDLDALRQRIARLAEYEQERRMRQFLAQEGQKTCAHRSLLASSR